MQLLLLRALPSRLSQFAEFLTQPGHRRWHSTRPIALAVELFHQGLYVIEGHHEDTLDSNPSRAVDNEPRRP